MTEVRSKAGVLAKEVYFEGGDVIRCYEGRFRFVLKDREPIVIGVGHAVVIYPDQRVTIEALEKKNLLRCAIFDGSDVAEYFDRFGFFDGIHGRTSEQLVPFEAIKGLLDAGDDFGKGIMSQMADALVTYAHDFRDNGDALVFDAVRQIRENLANRIVQLKPLCDQLKVSRAYLHRIFVRSGVGTPSEFIRREQLRIVLKLLKDDALSISDVAIRTGFLSQTHFSDFVRRYTGHAPRDLRR